MRKGKSKGFLAVIRAESGGTLHPGPRIDPAATSGRQCGPPKGAASRRGPSSVFCLDYVAPSIRLIGDCGVCLPVSKDISPWKESDHDVCESNP